MNPTLQQIVTDLERIVDQAKWAYTHGYWKAGHGLAHEHGTDLSKPEHKRLEGPTYDLEIGDHNARQAYQQACRTVMLADVTFATLLQGPQPVIRGLSIYATITELEHTAHTATLRARHILTITGHTKPLNHLRRQVDATIRNLSKALGSADLQVLASDRDIPLTLRCRICEWRRANPKFAGRCSTCWKWLKRKGEERPKHLDGINPRDAQRKRMERGEGWGAA